jgi:hypothetical protein
MSDFATARAALAAAREARAAARLEAWQAVEAERDVAARLERLKASFDPGDPDAVKRRKELEQLAGEAEAAAQAESAKASQARADALAALKDFAEFSDPRTNIGLLSDRSPLALLPVRIETRFADVGTAAEPRPQLWVRIYPDDCSVDTFEPTLSSTEVANAQRFWQGIWRAGGIEDDERGAWRGLVAAHGSGRAGYVADEYQPVNLTEKPAKADAEDQILIIGCQQPLAAGEAAAIGAYWQTVWLGDGDAAAQGTAFATLEATLGAARAAELRDEYVPFNLADAPATKAKAEVALSTSFVVFPADPPPKRASWSQAPQVKQLPERFVVLGYSGGVQVLEEIGEPVATPLHVGPDPSVDPEHSIHPDGEKLVVPDELAWMVDFERAEEVGMGIVVDLDAQQAENGFDRLLVLGVQMAATDADGKAGLEELLDHHRVGRSGLSLVAQGTPAHNSTAAGSGHARGEDADQSFDDRRDTPLFSPSADATQKRDGQVLAEALGIDPALLGGVHGAGGKDQMRARAMQRALWPATLGYWMDKMMTPVFGDTTVAAARWFFSNHVRGRGALPALRIGGQPYGILPTTAFSRLPAPSGGPSTVTPDPRHLFMGQLLLLLREIDDDWQTMSAGAAHVGATGDAHQTLLDIVGLHSGSVEYHWRHSESLSELYNIINLWGFGPDFWQALTEAGLQAAGADLLARLGHTGVLPDILKHVFMTEAGQIDNLIDDRPLSEVDPVRPYTDDGRNYVRWLIDAARTSLDALEGEEGFSDNRSPRMLLYLFLRHALLLGYYDTSYELHRRAEFSPKALAAMKPEPVFIHVDAGAGGSESRYAALYKTEPAITQSKSLLVCDYIAANLHLEAAAGLADQLDALGVLADAPTAELERAFAEHVDVCSYRFDSWLLGIVSAQLEGMRAAPTGATQPRTGVYLGAYAWVEDLRPSESTLESVDDLPPDLEATFAGAKPLMHDEGNGGYIFAPSLPHARTAAVLRSGYLANATPENPDTLSVNLSSERVRQSLSLLEGIRNGQSLGALLGYRFERQLHDSHAIAEVDKFILPLRKEFPLAGDSLASTKTKPDVQIEAVEARNVLDGRKLALRIRERGGKASYKFGAEGLPGANPDEKTALDAAGDALLDLYDAVSDLALAEGVHQAVQGNFDRVASSLDAYTKGDFPPEPEVVQTPAPGIGLTQRVALHLEPGLAAPAGATPRAVAEPALDAWLAGVLPSPGGVGCTVRWVDPVGGEPDSREVTLADLALRPLDLLDLVKPDEEGAMAELDDRILRFVLATAIPRADAELVIHYREAPSGKLSVFELSALVRSLAAVVQRARPLRATDAMLQGDAEPAHDAVLFADPARVSKPLGVLEELGDDLSDFLDPLRDLLKDPLANQAALVAGVDGFLDGAVALLERAARFGLPGCGWGFAYEWRRLALADLFAVLRKRIAAWDDRLADFDARIAAYDGQPPATEAERFAALQGAEALIVTVLDPLPQQAGELRNALTGKRDAFAAVREAFAAVTAANHASFHDALGAALALPPVDAFDPEPLVLHELETGAVAFAQRLAASVAGHGEEIIERGEAAAAKLAAHAAAADPAARVEALQGAARALFGDAFVLIPEFGLPSAQGTEWANALAESTSGALLEYLVDTAGVERPLDEWLCGAARVRPALHAWEAMLMLVGAFELPEPTLVPAQFPHRDGAPWLAMQFPSDPDHPLDGDRLLYTAHYAKPFNPVARQCGLLLDEWTETIPALDKDAGLGFHFDRPDNEPPQAILLVTPASSNGSWRWEDVTGALHETLDLAKKRALEPGDIDATAYSRLLPATIMAVTLYGISISTLLAVTNGVLAKLGAEDDA